MHSTPDRLNAARRHASHAPRRPRRPLLDRLIDVATREHTLRDHLFILAHCVLLSAIVGCLAALLIGAAK